MMRLFAVAAAAASALALLCCGLHGVEAVLTTKELAKRANVTCLLVFGDSSVDPGNNNKLPTSFKANFPPYGKNFFSGVPTGRFSNGRLPTDFIADALGIANALPAFLDPKLSPQQLRYGVSFASASSGYDDLTAEFGKVLPIHKQIEYLMHYKIHMRSLVGEKLEEEMVRNAIFVVSAGTNDFMQNYYLEPNRSRQFTEIQYENYLITRITKDIKEMHKLGARRYVLVGLPPLGCLPITMTIAGTTNCVDHYNQVATSFNTKVKSHLEYLKKLLGVKAAHFDIYTVWMDAVKNPVKYGFKETAKGCCGSGMVEIGQTCMGQSTCENPDEYLYWDAVHPTERMYKILADEAINTVVKAILG